MPQIHRVSRIGKTKKLPSIHAYTVSLYERQSLYVLGRKIWAFRRHPRRNGRNAHKRIDSHENNKSRQGPVQQRHGTPCVWVQQLRFMYQVKRTEGRRYAIHQCGQRQHAKMFYPTRHYDTYVLQRPDKAGNHRHLQQLHPTRNIVSLHENRTKKKYEKKVKTKQN